MPEPPSPVPEVPAEEQFIVGFGDSTFDGDATTAGRNVDIALSTLLDALPATLLKKFVGTFEDEKKAWCAIAVIRLDGTDPTLEHLQHEVASGKQGNKPGYVHIEWVEHNAPIALSFNDPLSPPLSQWALPRIGVTTPAWAVAPPAAAARTIVAIVDSGLRLPGGGLHEDLDPARVVPVAQSQPPWPPLFYLDNVDREGHGTLLAGTVAAITNNNVGIASPVHPGWNIHLMAVKFFEPPRGPTVADAIIGIAWAAGRFCIPFVLNRVKVINVSWHVPKGGGNLFGVFGLRWVLRRVASNMIGCVVVFAAGNDGTDNQIYPLFPANFSTDPQLQGLVMTVLATDHHDNKASFSNYSPISVDIGAPGIHILSTGRYLAQPGRYTRYSGTSAAAAYVSAGAGLVAALNPGWGPAQIVGHLAASADRIPQLMAACVEGKRLNLGNAVYAPVTVLTPVKGNVLPSGVPFNITWAAAFNNAAFAQLRIEFVVQPGGAAFLIAVVPIGPGLFVWQPNAGPLPPLPAVGTVRFTPVGGNSPVHSDMIQLV